jgi:hypothetical protein
VFSFKLFNLAIYNRYRIFKLRIVREIKGKTIVSYEKLRLVV